MTQPIFLIGPRGCGKTTVGHALAQREALYRDAAHHIVDATASPDRVVEQIMSMLCSATATPVS